MERRFITGGRNLLLCARLSNRLSEKGENIAMSLGSRECGTSVQSQAEQLNGQPFTHDPTVCQAEIIGKNPRFLDALTQSEMVASTDCTALILGETGTGKELIAKRIHDFSPRRHRALVKLNCAAIPSGLLESELFGCERGAFTGAVTQRIGRFESANKGTLFLDEVGDIPLELQPKLLRVLQEREFERLGSTRTVRTDVRLIAATHRNLGQMVTQGKFREDLFYRLNVFPITIPPLRERIDDIPQLVKHFTGYYAQRLGRRIDVIPLQSMEVLTQYSWPGNIRELQNFIERAVILSPGPTLSPPFAELMRLKEAIPAEPVRLVDVERAHISRVLCQVNGELTRAAALLGIPRTTLFYKLRRLGVSVPKTRKVRSMAAAC
ncbi:MAG TPA: sigma 54-interacting transcriptional regulator [Bryobacteraceae bacterium]|nr:sigma 54-interacting transcriptional regulator [Bryobacteraceae bacterium]